MNTISHLQENVTRNRIAYSVEEVSEKTSLSKAFLRLEIKRGKLKVKRFGRRVLVRDEDLKAYIENGSDGGQLALSEN